MVFSMVPSGRTTLRIWFTIGLACGGAAGELVSGRRHRFVARLQYPCNRFFSSCRMPAVLGENVTLQPAL